MVIHSESEFMDSFLWWMRSEARNVLPVNRHACVSFHSINGKVTMSSYDAVTKGDLFWNGIKVTILTREFGTIQSLGVGGCDEAGWGRVPPPINSKFEQVYLKSCHFGAEWWKERPIRQFRSWAMSSFTSDNSLWIQFGPALRLLEFSSSSSNFILWSGWSGWSGLGPQH